MFAKGHPTRQRAQLPRIFFIVAMLLFIWYYRDYQPLRQAQQEDATVNESDQEESQQITQLFRDRQSDVVVTATAQIVKILPDDTQGDKHQKMIVVLPSGHSLLLSHNIDIAPRVPAQEGATIRFRGEYEYSEQGGVIHWTHHDPAQRHKDGWIEFHGQLYQ
jgi:hypothetical protein